MPFRNPHRGPHGPHSSGHRRRYHGQGASILRIVLDLADQGLGAEELHNVIDQEIRSCVPQSEDGAIRSCDPGRGTPEHPVNPFTRAAALESEIRQMGDRLVNHLGKQRVVVAGEFPPHVLDQLLDHPQSSILQIHPPGPHGHLPPHFHHLAGRGFQGATSLQKIVGLQAETVLFEAYAKGGLLAVSPFVPLVLRMFPNAKTLVLESEDRAPHMTEEIEDSGFQRLVGLFD